MKGIVRIEKSFDDSREFSKTLEAGDFREFFKDEGDYLDSLVEVMKTHGKNDDEFTVTYKVTVRF